MLALYSAVALLASYASATIVISTPTNANSSEPLTVTWTSSSGDPSSFSLELSNPQLFNQQFAVGNNLGTSVGTFTFQMPTVPADNRYVLQAVNISNDGQVFGESGTFAIAVVATTSASATSTIGSSGSASSPSVTAPSTSGASTTPFGSTVSASSTSGTSNTQSGQSSGSSSSSSTPTPFNGSGTGSDATNLNFGWMSLALTGAAAVFGGLLAL
ncbi:hypothetical protein EUX98_g1023 [Antrodiella citrinella]|uniref:Yeast cell wall synthesis Kre9/Knh1-like N-terminal domain-containing protein n=1 Tax=Antrodiella citrinella TaxID=2447956 RepID=A0A4S4N5G0_9APHY|nr:hypothetical protein EUX98_g1023 [Antrodiella citrinella]